MAQDQPVKPASQPPKAPEFSVEYVYVIGTHEGHFGPFKYSGKSMALSNARSAGGQLLFQKSFIPDFDQAPTRPGEEELEASLVRIDNENVYSMMSGKQLELIADTDAPFDARMREFILANGSVHAVSVGTTNAGGNLASYARAQQAMARQLDKQITAHYIGAGSFKDQRPASFWEKHEIGQNLFRIDHIPAESSVPDSRKILAVDNAGFNTVFLPYWAAKALDDDAVNKTIDGFANGNDGRWFGVTTTMWDLHQLSTRREYKDLSGSVSIPAEFGGVLNFPAQASLFGGRIDLAALGVDLQQTVRVADINRMTPEQVCQKLEEDLKKNIYGPDRDITATFVEPAVLPYLSKTPADYDGARSAQTAAFQQIFEVRKLVMDAVLPGWRSEMIRGLEPAFYRFGTLMGWKRSDMEFGVDENKFAKVKKTNYDKANVKARDDKDVGLEVEFEGDVARPDEIVLKYRGVKLRTVIAQEQDSGTYAAVFLVPNKLIDDAHPANAGIRLRDGVIGYVGNIIPPIGGTPFPEKLYGTLATMVATRNAFQRSI